MTDFTDRELAETERLLNQHGFAGPTSIDEARESLAKLTPDRQATMKNILRARRRNRDQLEHRQRVEQLAVNVTPAIAWDPQRGWHELATPQDETVEIAVAPGGSLYDAGERAVDDQRAADQARALQARRQAELDLHAVDPDYRGAERAGADVVRSELPEHLRQLVE